MLIVGINKPQFEYDIHSLVKAFYPEQEVKVICDKQSKEYCSMNDNTNMYSSVNTHYSASGEMPDMRITFRENGIDMEVSKTLSKENGDTQQIVNTISHDSEETRPIIKNLLKQLIYRSLSAYLHKELPWGTLTGIRPTKIPMTMLEDGKSDEEMMKYMKETYSISEEKGLLSIEIAKSEEQLLSTLHCIQENRQDGDSQEGYSLYVGIPFCPTTCLYCSFTSYPIGAWKTRVSEYLDALEKEIVYTAEAFKDNILDTVYIGGGTPTTLQPEELERLLGMIEKYFDLSNIQEYTVEAGRADSITREKLKVLKAHNITRISVNPQTMKDETLKCIGRQHTVEQVKEAFSLAREEGFDNINMDIILGLPGEVEEDVANTVKEIKALAPDSLTVHSLAVKRASKLAQWIEENGISTLHNTDETMEIASQAAKEMGMSPYYLYRQKNMSGNFENVGYAKPGKAGIYNILIMEEKQTIAALGPGSISKVVFAGGRIERSDNVKDVGLYIERIDEMIERKKKLFELK